MTATPNPASLNAGAKDWRGIAPDDMNALTHPQVDEAEADPYAPGSEDYDARTREQVIELPGGLVRVDYGASV